MKTTQLGELWYQFAFVFFIFFVSTSYFLQSSASFAKTDTTTFAKTDTTAKFFSLYAPQAQVLQLWKRRYWSLLLHHTPHVSPPLSEADGAGFFLAADGKTNPQAELLATLQGVFSLMLVGKTQEPTLCAFPERSRWLKEQLQIKEQHLPSVKCTRFEQGLQSLHPASLTLVFSSYYLNSPSSMFGHTLLRIDRADTTAETVLLQYALNYAANVDASNPLSYTYQGLTGGFEGVFSVMPYYLKVKEYGEWENRDLWEYRLNLNAGQVERVLGHLWELGQTHFDYTFLKENCSYHLLSLLEIANPDLQLREHFSWWTAPAETLRLLAEQTNLIQEVTYRPARSTRILFQYEQLSAEDQQRFLEIFDPMSRILDNVSEQKKVQFLDLANDYLRYQMIDSPERIEEYQRQQHAILQQRNQLSALSPLTIPLPEKETPQRGHETSRWSMGTGIQEQESFLETSIRLGYHEMLDPALGYPEYAHMEAMSLQLRYFLRRRETVIPQATLLHILSISPLHALFLQPSWRIRAGSRLNGNCFYCRTTSLEGGIGMAISRESFVRKTLYLLGELETGIRALDSTTNRWDTAGILSIGNLLSFHSHWKLWAEGRWRSWNTGDADQTLFVRLRYAQDEHWKIQYSYEGIPGRMAHQIQAGFYF